MMDFAGRRDALRERMAVAQCEALVVTHLPDVQYLSGFSGSNAALLVLSDSEYLATDGRYVVQAGAESPGVELIVTRQLLPELLRAAAGKGVREVGFDAATLTVQQWRRAAAEVPEVGLEAVDVDVSGLRRIKQPAEVAALREACAISTRALERLLDEISTGMTELEIARRLELHMGLEGAGDRAFDSIVASGPNSAVPHHQPTQRQIAAGDLLKIDFGAKYAGYHADCTRTFVVAADPADWQMEIHAVVARAQQAGADALVPGCVGQEVDAIARKVIEDAGFGQYYDHGLGHGVGLEIHEAPFLGPNSAHTVEAGVPVTVEPGVYLPGRGGVRIEDTVIVHDDHVEVLTSFPRGLARVG
ncbi:MAG: Xaa-Pro peptidase family protein [Candidatus Nanopelagicales bacterium]|nr:Xaa-Pro peptidase family protein [Candidatus Nanopelagicales bacterium]